MGYYKINADGSICKEENDYIELLVYVIGKPTRITKDIYDNSEKIFEEVFETMTEQERKVLERRWGIFGVEKIPVINIGSYFGVTSERIRQIEAKAYRKLRHPSRLKKFQSFDVDDFHIHYDKLFYIDPIRYELKKEIYGYLYEKKIRTTYLTNILEKNKIKLSFREVILAKYDEDADSSTFETIELQREDNIELFKYKKCDRTKMALNMFKEIIAVSDGILCSDILSPSFQDLLLKLGYIHMSDVINDIVDLKEKLSKCRMENYVNELEKYRKYIDIKKHELILIDDESELGKYIELNNMNEFKLLIESIQNSKEKDKEEWLNILCEGGKS